MVIVAGVVGDFVHLRNQSEDLKIIIAGGKKESWERPELVSYSRGRLAEVMSEAMQSNTSLGAKIRRMGKA